MNDDRICVKCGKLATKWTRMNLPTPVCESCATEEATKEWKRISHESFCLRDFYNDFVDTSSDNTYKMSNSIVRLVK